MMAPPTGRKRGFSLIEIAVVTSIIGILAALAIPAYLRSKENAVIATLEQALRLFEQEFDTYALEHGEFPPSTTAGGTYPTGMEGEISFQWIEPSPIGGTYRWVYTTEADAEDRSGYIEIVNDSSNPILMTPARLEDIDEDFDNGDTSSGRLRINGLNVIYYVKL